MGNQRVTHYHEITRKLPEITQEITRKLLKNYLGVSD